MTPADVALSMGSQPSDRQQIQLLFDEGGWAYVASDSDEVNTPHWHGVGGKLWDQSDPRLWPYEKTDMWVDGYVDINVVYRDGKACMKIMAIRQPPRSKLWGWLNWLRGIMGW